jgi:hypothetical protein
VLFQLFASFGTEAFVSRAPSPYLSETDYYLSGLARYRRHYDNYNYDNTARLQFFLYHNIFSLKLQTHVAFRISVTAYTFGGKISNNFR